MENLVLTATKVEFLLLIFFVSILVNYKVLELVWPFQILYIPRRPKEKFKRPIIGKHCSSPTLTVTLKFDFFDVNYVYYHFFFKPCAYTKSGNGKPPTNKNQVFAFNRVRNFASNRKSAVFGSVLVITVVLLVL